MITHQPKPKPPPQAEFNQAGFTLVEIVLVMAISSLLLVIVFAGQRSLSERTRFDAGINKVIQAFAYGRNYALAGVNITGGGDSKDSFTVGVGMEIQNDHGDKGLVEMEPKYSPPDSNGDPDYSQIAEMPFGSDSNSCIPGTSEDGDECWEHFFPETSNLMITAPTTGILMLFLPTNAGLRVCTQTTTAVVLTNADACLTTSGPPIQFELKDRTSGLKATIEVDRNNGFAHRVK